MLSTGYKNIDAATTWVVDPCQLITSARCMSGRPQFQRDSVCLVVQNSSGEVGSSPCETHQSVLPHQCIFLAFRRFRQTSQLILRISEFWVYLTVTKEHLCSLCIEAIHWFKLWAILILCVPRFQPTTQNALFHTCCVTRTLLSTQPMCQGFKSPQLHAQMPTVWSDGTFTNLET